MAWKVLQTDNGIRAGAAVLYLVLAILLTLPLALHLADAVPNVRGPASPDLANARQGAWVLGWVTHELFLNPLRLFQANIFHPTPDSLAFGDHRLGIAIPMLPVTLASGSPMLAQNLFALASFAIAAFGMFLLAMEITGNPKAAFVAGLVFAFAPIRFAYLSSAPILAVMWMPYVFLYLDRYFRGGSLRNLAISAGFYLVLGLSSWTLFCYAVIALLLYALFDALLYRGELAGSVVKFLIVFLAASLLLVPFALPYRQVAMDLGLLRDLGISEFHSADIQDYLFGNIFHPMHGPKVRSFLGDQGGGQGAYSYVPVFPGYSVLILTLVALSPFGFHRLSIFRRREFFFHAGLTAVGIVLTLGPELKVFGAATGVPLPFRFVARLLPPLPDLGVTYRFHLLTILGLGMLAAFGFNKLVRSERGDPAPKRVIDFVATALISAIVLFEYLSVPVPMTPTDPPDSFPPIYQTLAASTGHGALFEAPYPHPRDTGFARQRRIADLNASATYYSISHWWPLVNGHQPLYPPLFNEAEAILSDLPDHGAFRLLQAIDCSYLLLHCADRPALEEAESRFLAAGGFDKVAAAGNDLLLKVAPAEQAERQARLQVPEKPTWISRFGGGQLLVPLTNTGELPAVFTRPHRIPIRVHWWRGPNLLRIQMTELELPLIITTRLPTSARLDITPPEGANRVGVLIESSLFAQKQIEVDSPM